MKDSESETVRIPFSLLVTVGGIFAIVISILAKENYFSALILCLIGLCAFIISLFYDTKH